MRPWCSLPHVTLLMPLEGAGINEISKTSKDLVVMTYRLFISYATGDDDSVVQLDNSLSKLENVDVYIAEWIQTSGKDMDYKVKDGLDSSRAVIVLLTFNSTNTMWLNQTIGYAFARNIPIIPIVEKGIDVKGFLEGKEYIVYQRGNFRHNIYQIISKLRSIFPQYLMEQPLSRFYITCHVCEKKFLEPLPSQELLDKKVNKGKHLVYGCQFCSETINVDPMTLITFEN